MEDNKLSYREQTTIITEVSDNDMTNSLTDEFGVIYSADRKRLLMAPKTITEYTVLEGTEIICDRAFEECDSLQRVIVSHGVKAIGSEAFGACSSLVSISLPETLSQIKEWAFEGCISLKLFSIPSSVTTIERGVLEGCNCEINSKSEYFKSNGSDLYSYQDKKLIYCTTHIAKYNIPGFICIIGEYAFFNCSMLKSIVIPESVVKIEEGAFCGCDSLFDVKLPNSLKSIGEHAYSGCESIKAISIPESVAEIGNTAFEDCISLKRIYVPASTKVRFEKMLPGYEGRIIESVDTNPSNYCAGYNDDDDEGYSLKGNRFGSKHTKSREKSK